MKKPIIAIDVDDVLSASATAFIEFSNQRWGTHLRIEDIDEDWSKMWQIDERETEIRSREFHKSGIISNLRQYDEALPVLEWLSQSYELVVATSRNASVNTETIEWITKHYGGIFSHIYFSGIYDDTAKRDFAHRLTKTDLLQTIGAAYLIDDQPKHCHSAAHHGMRAILFGEYPWNDQADVADGVVRCSNWGAVRDYFHELTY